MPVYAYKARNAEGKVSQGTLEAANETAAVKTLQNQNLIITKIADTTREAARGRVRQQRRHARVKSEDLLFFIRELATLLEAGISLFRALEVISPQIGSQKLYETLEVMKNDLRAGSTLKSAIAKHPKVFPAIWEFLIEAGEAGGHIPFILGQIATHLEASIAIRKKILTAIFYPCILISVALGAVAFFLLHVIPIFSKVYASFNAQIPALTLTMIAASNFAGHYFLHFLILIGFIIYILKHYFSTAHGKRVFDHAILRVPVLGPLISNAILARVAINLSTLTQSGVALLKSIKITSGAAGNAAFSEALNNMGLDIQQGSTLYDAMSANPLFTPMILNMVKVGEESGRLTDMLNRAANYYESKVDVFVSRLSITIEPAILIFVGGIIGVIVTAMFLPLIKLSASIH